MGITLVGPAELKGMGSIGIIESELIGTPSFCGSLHALDLIAFSLDNRTSFLTLERWLAKKSLTYTGYMRKVLTITSIHFIH